VNHSAPSGPAVMSSGLLAAVGTGNSVTAPDIVIRPILSPSASANHSAPSGPAAMPIGKLAPVGMGNSVIAPYVVIRAILLPFSSANHSAPSDPAVIPAGLAAFVGTGNSVIVPAVVIRPILFALNSVNHSAPSDPAAMKSGWLEGVGVANSLTTCAPAPADQLRRATVPIARPRANANQPVQPFPICPLPNVVMLPPRALFDAAGRARLLRLDGDAGRAAKVGVALALIVVGPIDELH